MKPTRALLLAACASLLAPTFASADLLPNPDSVDAHCTDEEQCPDSAAWCSQEAGSKDVTEQKKSAAEYGACVDGLKAKGLARRCQRGGKTVTHSLYCKPDEKGAWSARLFGSCSKRR